MRQGCMVFMHEGTSACLKERGGGREAVPNIKVIVKCRLDC